MIWKKQLIISKNKINKNDKLYNRVNLKKQSHLKFTSQAAEKIYFSYKNISKIHNIFTTIGVI